MTVVAINYYYSQQKMNSEKIPETSDRAVCIANGAFNPEGLNKDRMAKVFTVAVDGGIKHYIDAGISPKLYIGDFDSVSKKAIDQFPSIKVIQLKRDKDDTDLEAAIQHLFEQNHRIITVLGWGVRSDDQRHDHFITNILLLAKHPLRVTLESHKETLVAISDKSGEVTLPTFKGQTISIHPIGDKAKVRSVGLNWELTPERPLTICDKSQSNFATGETVNIEVVEGTVLCTINKVLSSEPK